MQFASFRDFRLRASAILGRSRGEESVIITRRGKPVAVLIPTTEDMLEEVLSAVARARLKAAVDAARKEAARSGADRLTQAEIDAEIRKARRARGR